MATKIVRLITRLNVGGPAQHALLLTRGLRPQYDTVLAAGTPTASEGELLHPEVDVRRVPLVREVSGPDDARAFAAVRRLLAAQRPRILHTHTAKAGTVGRTAAMTLGPATRPLTVHTFHGHVLRGYFGPNAERGIVTAEALLARRTDLLIAVSTEVRDELLDRGIGRRGQFEVVPLGLDLAGFLAVEGPSGALRDQLGLPAGTPLVGVVGRLVGVKDHATALAAMAHLPGVHLAVIGDGDLRGALEAEAARLGLAGRVHFTGWSPDVPAAVSDLDVVVLCSKNEGTPVSLIEASAASRPIVATAVGGVPSVVEDGVTGRLVPPGDPAALAAGIREALADAEQARRWGAAGRARVDRRFGAERLLDDMRRIYEGLLGGRSRRPPG
jgi:glycosyltransferase involved in cell wall biosynthesis